MASLLLRSSTFYFFGSIQGLVKMGGQPLWFAGAVYAFKLADYRNSDACRAAATFEIVNYGLVLVAGRSLVSKSFGVAASAINGTLTLHTLATKPLFPTKSLPQRKPGTESTHMSLMQFSDMIGNWWYATTPPPPKTLVGTQVNQANNSQIAAGLYKFTSQTERIMRLLKFLEPMMLAASLVGWTGGPQMQRWFKSTRCLITVMVRVPKAINAHVNPKFNADEDHVEAGFRVVAGPCYASLAVASALAEMVKLDILSPIPGASQFLKDGGTLGNLIAGAGGFYCWHRHQQRVYGLRYNNIAAGAIQPYEKARFGQLANGMRYGLEGLVGLGALLGLEYSPWVTVAVKGLPAFIGVYAGCQNDF